MAKESKTKAKSSSSSTPASQSTSGSPQNTSFIKKCIRKPFVWIWKGLKNPVVRILIIAVCYAIYLDREHVWEYLEEHTVIPDVLETLNPYTLQWLKDFDAVLYETCGDVVEPWCLPNLDGVMELLDDSPLKIEGSKYQTRLFRVLGFFFMWPRSWPSLILLLHPSNKWTASFCNSSMKNDYFKKLVLLDIVRYPRYSMGELKEHHEEVAILWEQWFKELRPLNSTRLHSLLDTLQNEGDDAFLGSRTMVELVQFQHAQTMKHLLQHACPESAKALIESDRGNTTLLHAMAREGNTDMIRVLANIRPEAERRDYVSMMDSNGYTAENLARLAHFYDTAELLQTLAGASEPATTPMPSRWPRMDADPEKDGHEPVEFDESFQAGWDIDDASLMPQEWLPTAEEPQCFADVVSAEDFNWRTFLNHYDLRSRPLLIRGGAKHPRAKRVFTRDGLLEVAGRVKVVAEDFPYAEHQVNSTPEVTTIFDYLNFMRQRNMDDEEKKRSRLQYVFQSVQPRNFSQKNLSFVFFLPRILENHIQPFNTQFYLGGDLMGAPFHYHENSFNSLVYGRKLWLLYPPSEKAWVNDAMYRHMVRTKGAPGALRCVQESGDLLFVPRQWTHGAMCLSDCIGVAHEYVLNEHEVPPEYRSLRIHHDPYNSPVTKIRENRYYAF